MDFLKKYSWTTTAFLTLPGLLLGFPVSGILTFGLVGLGLKKIIPPAAALGGFLVLVLAGVESLKPSLMDYLPLGEVVSLEGEVTGDALANSFGGWIIPGLASRAVTREGLDSQAHFPLNLFNKEPLLPGVRWKAQGILNAEKRTLQVKSWIILRNPPWWELKRKDLRTYLENRFDSLAPQVKGLSQALFLGSKVNLTTLEKDQFRKAGMSHLLALSGAHLSIWVALLPWIFPFTPKIWKYALVPGIVLGLYLWIVGMMPSLVRAYISLLLGIGYQVQGKPAPGLENLGKCWLILLILCPPWFRDISFQLSFLAMGGIHLISPRLRSLENFLPGVIAQGLEVSLGAFLAVLPLGLVLFGEIQALGILGSIPAGIITGAYLGVCGVRILPIPALDGITGSLLEILSWTLQEICQLCAFVPSLKPQSALILFMGIMVGLLVVLVYKYRCERTRKLRLSQGNKGIAGLPGF